MQREQPHLIIQSYMLRLWHESADGQLVLRVMLTNVQTGERQGFPTLEAAFEYLTSCIEYETK